MGRVPSLRFSKYHGLGNDFIVLDHRNQEGPIDAELARRLCDRHRGIGADGVLSLLPTRTKSAGLRLHIWNADGSAAEMCGNGLRCVIRFLAEERAETGELVVDTDAGLRRGALEADGRVRVTLGRPKIGRELAFEKNGSLLSGLEISMGNPHFVLEPAPGVDLRARVLELGPWLQARPEFPESTNVELMRLAEDGASLELWVYERGAGLTQACGTGAAAAAVVADRLELGGRPARRRVILPGGPLEVELPGASSGEAAEIAIIGEAVRVFEGTAVW